MHDDINLVNSEVKLLYDIRELLIEQNKLLNLICTKEEHKNIEDLSILKRSELMARVKELPDKPQGWTKLSNENMRALLKGVD